MTPYKWCLLARTENDLPPNDEDTEGLLRPGVVAFRGTESFADLLNDLYAVAVPWHGCRVHAGFLEAYEAVREAVLNHAGEQEFLLLTGHSLGGALAHLAALDVHKLWPDKRTALVTFGCPRVGDAGMARALIGVPQTRYVYGRDRITTVPHLLLPGTVAFHSSRPTQLGCWVSRWIPPFATVTGRHDLEYYAEADA